MRQGRAEALRAAIAERARDDANFRRAYADLRETCAFAVDPRTADRDLARLIVRYLDSEGAPTPVGPRFEAVLTRLSDGTREPHSGRPPLDEKALPQAVREEAGKPYGKDSYPTLPQGGVFLADGVAFFLRESLGLRLGEVRALDPWAGEGEIAAALSTREAYANESDPIDYAKAARRGGTIAVLADSFRLPDRRPTPGFDFCDDENAARVGDEQALAFSVIATDLRRATRPDTRANRRLRETWGEGNAALRWMVDRLAPKGVIAFLSDEAFVDEPASAGLREGLAREFGLVAHLVLPGPLGVTFLVRGGGGGRILYAEADAPPEFDRVEWRELQPTAAHVWRTEILREEWATFLPLVGERGAIFTERHDGMPDGADAAVPTPKARRVLRRPFMPAWRTLDRKARREPMPTEGPTIVTLEPFGVVAADAAVDRRLGGPGTTPLVVGGRPSAEAMRRFRAAYGAAVTERDVFDATFALLNHPEYRVRYREDLRRGVPRLPLPDEETLAVLLSVPDAPSVGPGTAFRTGWIAEELFESGTVPDYDDPFASPYARADVDPGFLLLVGLGAALYRVQVDFERLRPYRLARLEAETLEPRVERMRLSADRARLVIDSTLTLEGIPPEAFLHRFGRRSAPEWIVDAFRARAGFDPNRDDDPARPARLFAQAVAVGLETRRLAAVVGRISLLRE